MLMMLTKIFLNLKLLISLLLVFLVLFALGEINISLKRLEKGLGKQLKRVTMVSLFSMKGLAWANLIV
jgi:hypothetical protein